MHSYAILVSCSGVDVVERHGHVHVDAGASAGLAAAFASSFRGIRVPSALMRYSFVSSRISSA
jgi:hypothetical protein